MGRWSDRRAAKRARKQYLADYYGQDDAGPTGPANPYRSALPPESTAGRTSTAGTGRGSRRRVRRAQRRKRPRHQVPGWVNQPARLDPALAGRLAREQRRTEAGWPTARHTRFGASARAGGAAAPASTTPAASTSAPSGRDGDRSGRGRNRGGLARSAATPSGSRPRRTGRSGAVPRRQWIRPVLVLVAACVVIPVVAGLLLAAPGGTDLSERVAADFEVIWETEVPELDPDGGYSSLVPVDSPDRYTSAGTEIVTTEDTWVVMVEQDTSRALLGLDPRDGSVRWRQDLDRSHCSARTGPDGTVVCLSQEAPGGSAWTGHVLDAASGDELTSWQAPLTGAWGVHLTDAGLLVLAESDARTYDRLTLLDVTDGTEAWAVDLLDIDDAESMFYEREVDDVEHTIMSTRQWQDEGEHATLSASTTALFVDTGTGDVTPRHCYPILLTEDALGCDSYRHMVLYHLDGTERWSSARVDLAQPAYRGEHVLVNIAGESLHHTDWDSGYVGASVQRVERGSIATGTQADPFLMSDHELLSLAPDGSQVRWSEEIHGMNSITTVLVTDEVAIVNAFSAMGLDLTAGERLWTRYGRGNLQLAGDALIATNSSSVALLEIP
ncbi:PQQ-binding-like beta-propeller repeat protein [Pseudactinotalea sp. Z1732]|uniref:outer membrane protein assembly factor BamB family protein n=1 Tax=Micrococcales TaxID=85006 RepID=UPI003C7B5562